MMIAKPFKSATVKSITQGFHDGHKAMDLTDKYGTFLVAPEDCTIIKIITPKVLDGSSEGLDRGYGIVMESFDSYREHFYHHCLPIFPVNEGDKVEQGKIVAQMGNSGFVMKGGKVIENKDKLKPPFPGKHLHWAVKINGTLTNPINLINWTIPIRYDIIGTVKIILLKMLKLLKR